MDDYPSRIGIVAGGGSIPLFIANHLKEQGNEPFIIMLKGEAKPEFRAFEHIELQVAEIGKLVKSLHKNSVKHIVFIGSVKKRPSLRQARLDWITLRMIRRLLPRLDEGDDALLSEVVRALEAENISVLGAHEVAPSLLTPDGVIAGNPSSILKSDTLQLGVNAARCLGDLDAGQGVVVIGRRVVALEGAEGTDAMLARIADLKSSGKLANKKGGILIKMAKPKQELRTDLPTIGIESVRNAFKAQLDGIVVESGRSMIVNIEQTALEAQKLGLFILGWSNNDT